MKKQAEKRIVDEVYHGSRQWTVAPAESPDFLAQQDGRTILGIEVTEYFLGEVDARLQHIPQYAMELLEGEDVRHKDDRESLRVEKVTYHAADSDKGQDVMAIIREVAPISGRLARLQEVIETKSRKGATYLRSAPVIDLVISDTAHALRFQQFESIMRPFSVSACRDAVVTSPFREVFLVTKRHSDERVCIPLKANAFVAETMLLERLVKETWGDSSTDPRAAFAILVLCLASSGFASAKLASIKQQMSVSYASIDYIYTENGKNIQDHSVHPEYDNGGVGLEDITPELESEFRDKANELLELRGGYSACVELLFPAHVPTEPRSRS